MHHTYHDHVDHEQEKGYHGSHYATKHYEQHNHRDHEHPANHRNEKHHSNDHPKEHHQHHGTHPERRSHHSDNRVSNPNVAHHHAVHEQDTHSHTFIRHQEGKKHSEPRQNPNSIPKAPVTKRPSGAPQPGRKPVNPVTPRKPVATKSPTGTPGTKPQSGKPTPLSPSQKSAFKPAPPHHGINFNAYGTSSATFSNKPGEGVATGISAVNKQGKVPTTSHETYDPQGNTLASTVHNIGHTLKTWWQNGTSTKPETSDQKANDPVYQVGQWEYNTLKSLGL